MVKKVGLNLMKVQQLYGGDFAGVLEVAKLADAKGVDEVHISDHVAISAAGHAAKVGFPYDLDFPGWYEPIAVLSAVAAVTKNVKLATNIMIATLRPAILLAKQVATLDVISNGRVEIGFGVGWQKEEFDASNIPFEGRYGMMIEQIKVCRALWGGAPASFDGQHVKFRDFYSLPLPVQGARLPISIGLPPTPRNLERMAEVGDGWFPHPVPAAELKEGIDLVRGAFIKRGRSPKELKVTAALTLLGEGVTAEQAGIKDPFAEVPSLFDAGADVVVAHTFPYCKTKADIGPFIDRLVALKK